MFVYQNVTEIETLILQSVHLHTDGTLTELDSLNQHVTYSLSIKTQLNVPVHSIFISMKLVIVLINARKWSNIIILTVNVPTISFLILQEFVCRFVN